MNKLADNFIFRKVRRLRRTESDVAGGSLCGDPSPSAPLRRKLSLDVQLSHLPSVQERVRNSKSDLPPLGDSRRIESDTSKNHQARVSAPTSCSRTTETTGKSELFAVETPTQSISERIANEEVEDVMKNCSSVLGALPRRIGGGVPPTLAAHAVAGCSNADEGPTNVGTTGLVDIQRADAEHLPSSGDPMVGSKLEQYVESLCDFSSIFSELSASIMSALSSQNDVADRNDSRPQLKNEVNAARRFSYRVDSPRFQMPPNKGLQPERPSSTPRLVQTNSHCHMARVTAITQEWVIDREMQNATATGVCQSHPSWQSSLEGGGGDRQLHHQHPLQNDHYKNSDAAVPPPHDYSSTFPRAAGVGKGGVGDGAGMYSTATRQYKLMSQSAEARLIEKAILDISERISQQQGANFTRAQAVEREEMLRAKLAEMILHLGPEQDVDYDYGRVLKEPILILRDKLNSLQRRVNSAPLRNGNDSALIEKLGGRPPHPQSSMSNGRLAELKMKERQRNISAHMTPLISLMHQKLESLEGVVDVGEDRPSGRSTPYEERRAVHCLLVGINEEINKIHELCRRNSQAESLNAVVQVLHRVCLQMDKIIETLRVNGPKAAALSPRHTPPFPVHDGANSETGQVQGALATVPHDHTPLCDVAVNCNVDISKEEEQVQSFILDHRAGPSPYHWRESAAVTLRDSCTSPFKSSTPLNIPSTIVQPSHEESSELHCCHEVAIFLEVDFNCEGTHRATNHTALEPNVIYEQESKNVVACDEPAIAMQLLTADARPPLPTTPQFYLQLSDETPINQGYIPNVDRVVIVAYDEEGSSSHSDGEDDVPVLFKRPQANAPQKETAILTDDDDDDEGAKGASKSEEANCDADVQLYNMTASCSETFHLRKRRKHALLNAVIYPEVGAKIRATFAGNSFQVDVERVCETGRDSVVIEVSGEYCSKWARVQKTHDSILIERSISADEPNVESKDRDGNGGGGGGAYVDSEALSKIAVSIMAKSVEDRVFVYLEEIPWGEVEMTVAAEEDEPPFNKSHEEDTMVRSATSYKDTSSGLILNITVNENQEEAKCWSVASHHSVGGGSQKSLATSDGAPSQASTDMPTYVIKPHSTASITCELNAFVDREAEIEWYKGTERVAKKEGKYEFISEDLLEVLIILDVTTDDGQLYQIKVNGEVYPVAYLIVEEGEGGGAQQEPPRFLTPRQTLFMMQGQTAVLSCQMHRPHLEVEWYKEKERLNGDGAAVDERVFFEQTPDGWYRLIIEEVDFRDQGTYDVCHGDVSTSITLIVEELIEEREVQVSSADTDDEELNDYLVPTGSTATIACELDKTSSVHALHWQRNNLDLGVQTAGKFEHVTGGNKHYLVIHNAQPADSGVYSVRVNEVKFKVAQITISDQQQSLGGSRVRHISASSINRAR